MTSSTDQETIPAIKARLPWWRVAGVKPVFAMFLLEGFVIGNWIPRIPDVKTLFELTNTQLGICLFIFSFGTLISFLAGGYILTRLGVRTACLVAAPIYTICTLLVPFLPNVYVLGICLYCAGSFIGALEIAMNTGADALETRHDRRFMSKAHGFWSLGTLFGALIGGASGALGLTMMAHFLIILPLTAVFGAYMALGIIDDEPQTDGPLNEETTSPIKLPNPSLILLCLMPIGIMVVEGSFIDWSALFVREVLLGGSMASGLIFSAFALIMTATRLNGDWILEKYGPLKVAQVSALSAAFGTALFALSPNVVLAFIGALFAGLGVAIVYPLAMSAAAKRPGNAQDNLAAMSLFAFSSFLIAPPLLGIVADIAGLRMALLLVVPLALVSFFMSPELNKES